MNHSLHDEGAAGSKADDLPAHTPPAPADTPARRKRGRPHGAATQTLPSGEHELPRCYACGSTELRVLDTITRHFSGVRNGHAFNRVRWQRCACANCHARRDVKTYLMVADE